MTASQIDNIYSAGKGELLSRDQVLALADYDDLPALLAAASRRRDSHHGNVMSYSRKVFIPLTQLCRDVCHYCTFAQTPRHLEQAYLSPEQVLEIALAGKAAGCHEALFTLGDKPELRYRKAREELDKLGYASTLAYLAAMAEMVLQETGLLPHLNPGIMSTDDVAKLRQISVSQGIMLESVAERLCQKGGPHYGSPDKEPGLRLATMRAAGAAAIPFTSGILIGIGETRAERLEALLALRDVQEQYGHIQEIIIQNFRAKPDTLMADAPEPSLEELLWTLAVARLIFAAEMNIQAPPNLSPGVLPQLINAGINDWGGVSPVTKDHVNPEAPWPHLDHLAQETAAAGKVLIQRLAIYPHYTQDLERWVDERFITPVLQLTDASGFAREDAWTPGTEASIPVVDFPTLRRQGVNELGSILVRARDGCRLEEADIVRLFEARGEEFTLVCATADQLRREVSGDTVAYVVNRNINYTNVCYFRCQFCAFSKGRLSENLRGRPYDLDLDEIARRSSEAWERGATEVCMQGGIHPEYTGATYLEICRTVKAAVPGMHVHAFSPLEVWQGAHTLNLPLSEFLGQLRQAGLGSLPGTAAEILDDEIRRIICPDKINTGQWLSVMEAAHNSGIKTTSTIMYGHVEQPVHWARHLLRLRDLQARTGGFTEFVPLPFVAMEAPLYRKGKARRGPTFREAVLMHAVARLTLHPHITNVQASWVKMGPEGVKACLNAGANDLGGTLMNESITRAAGAEHGQEMPPEAMQSLIRDLGRTPLQRTTLYADVLPERIAASFAAQPLAEIINTPARRYDRSRKPQLVRSGAA